MNSTPRRTYGAYNDAPPWKSSIRIRPTRTETSGRKFRMPRRQQIVTFLIIGVSAFLGISFVLMFRDQAQGTRAPDYQSGVKYEPIQGPLPEQPIELDNAVLLGTATAPKLENATLKAELGNAGWKLLHTTMAKFPDKPTDQDSQALKSFIHLFARLYPCGDCARHFQQLLQKYPPQVSTRSNAAAWACHVHNEVNKRLKKDIFDCSKIGDFYDCGCAEDAATAVKDGFAPLELEKEGLTRGG